MEGGWAGRAMSADWRDLRRLGDRHMTRRLPAETGEQVRKREQVRNGGSDRVEGGWAGKAMSGDRRDLRRRVAVGDRAANRSATTQALVVFAVHMYSIYTYGHL